MFELVTNGNVASRLQTCYSETINPLKNPIIVLENSEKFHVMLFWFVSFLLWLRTSIFNDEIKGF